MTTYEPEEHRADGGFRVIGLPLLFVGLLITAIAVGWLASFIGQWFYLILMFPLGMALVLVFAGILLGKWTHLRSPVIAGLAGLFAGLATMTSMHYFDYLRVLDRDEVKAVMAALPPDQRLSFAGFMNMQAKEGVSIGRGGKDGFNLGYVGSWIYWGLEVALVAGACFVGVMVGALEPYCAYCEKWKVYRDLGSFEDHPDMVKLTLEDGKVDRLRRHRPVLKGGQTILAAAICPTGGDSCPITVKLEHMTINDKKEVSRDKQVELTYPGEALVELEAIFEGAPESPEPEEPPERPKKKKKVKRSEDEDY